MQIRSPVEVSIEEYLEQKAWEQARLPCCPFDPEGGCGLARHGTYPRKFPDYCLVARWYCPCERRTISLLPDFFASRFPGTLDEVEQTVNIVQSCVNVHIFCLLLLTWSNKSCRFFKPLLSNVTRCLKLSLFAGLKIRDFLTPRPAR